MTNEKLETRIGVRLDESQAGQLKDMSRKFGVKKSWLIRRALTDQLRQWEQKGGFPMDSGENHKTA